jgi:hypothetical protein
MLAWLQYVSIISIVLPWRNFFFCLFLEEKSRCNVRREATDRYASEPFAIGAWHGEADHMQSGDALPLDEILEQSPFAAESPELKEPLLELARGLDGLGRLDESSQQVFIDETSLRGLLRAHFPSEFEDPCIGVLKQAPGSRLLDAMGKSTIEARPVYWQVVAANAEGFAPTLEAALGSFGLTASSTTEELRKAIQQRMPHLDPEQLTRRVEELVTTQATATSREATAPADAASVWDCCLRHLGWWGLAAFVVVLGAVIVAASATGGFAWELFWWLVAIGVVGDTLVTVLNCIIDPFS